MRTRHKKRPPKRAALAAKNNKSIPLPLHDNTEQGRLSRFFVFLSMDELKTVFSALDTVCSSRSVGALEREAYNKLYANLKHSMQRIESCSAAPLYCLELRSVTAADMYMNALSAYARTQPAITSREAIRVKALFINAVSSAPIC